MLTPSHEEEGSLHENHCAGKIPRARPHATMHLTAQFRIGKHASPIPAEPGDINILEAVFR